MSRTYAIHKGDTLAKVAKKFYGDAVLFKKIAEYNGIRKPDLIMVGQIIEIPSRKELEGETLLPAAATGLVPPVGLEQIVATFGNINEFIREDGSLDPRWEAEYLGQTPLPFAIPLSWDQSKSVTNLRCHKKLVDVFRGVFDTVVKEGLSGSIRTFGGCFNYRPKRTSGKLSTHSWGIAIDLNPGTNRQGTSGDMDADVVEVFGQYGFKWGGDWTGSSKDPMHFQFCTGY